MAALGACHGGAAPRGSFDHLMSADFRQLWRGFLDASGEARLGVADQLVTALLADPSAIGDNRRRRIAMHALLVTAREDGRALVPHVVSQNTAEARHNMDALLRFCVAVRAAATGRREPQAWMLSARGREAAVLVEEGAAMVVNLSHLDLAGLAEVDGDSMAAMMDSLQISLRCPVCVSDLGESALPHLAGVDAKWQAQVLAASSGQRARSALSDWRRKPRGVSSFDLAQGGPYMRIGSTELFALWCYHHDRDATLAAAEAAAVESARVRGDSAATFGFADTHWSRTDPYANVMRLSRNAGWYAAPGTAGAAFADWAERYTEAMCNGYIFYDALTYYLRVAPMVPAMCTRPIGLFDEFKFIANIAGKRVVVVSAFADQIRERFESGALARLWADAGVGPTVSHLEAVKAPVSVFPNMPHESWTHSYDQLEAETREAVRRSGADILIASCGCYGLPLVDAVARAEGVWALSYGHYVNVLFGVLSQAGMNAGFYKRAAKSAHWVSVALDVPGLGAVDGGRYAPPSGGGQG